MKFNWYGQQFKTNIKYAIHNTLNQVGDQSVFQIRQSFPPGSFKKWRSKRPGVKYHWSSRPGQPPSVDTARLLESIRYDLEREVAGERLRIGGYTEYALAMELGLAHKNVQPRPYLAPHLVKIEKGIMVILSRNMGNVLR
jgi:hypothetical protein